MFKSLLPIIDFTEGIFYYCNFELFYYRIFYTKFIGYYLVWAFVLFITYFWKSDWEFYCYYLTGGFKRNVALGLI